MPHFAYKGRNARGELVKGVLEGADSGAVADQLFNTGITPVEIDAVAPAGARGAGAGLLRCSFGEPKVELADLMLFCRQMYTLLKAGVPIMRALAGLQESAAQPDLRAVHRRLRDSLDSRARAVASRCASTRRCSPASIVSLVRVGELTGRLDEVFLRLYDTSSSRRRCARTSRPRCATRCS